MGQTLTHGVYLPDEGERNCYSGLAANWQLLDGAVGTVAEHTSALAGKAPLVHTHTKSDITDFPAYGTTAGTICEGNDSRLSDARTPVAHTHTKSDVTDLLNSNFIPSSNGSYNLGSLTNRWGTVYGIESNVRSDKIDFTDTTTTGTRAHWHFSNAEKNGSTFFQTGSQRNHSAGLNEEHFRIKNANNKWADLYIQLDDNNQFTIGTTAHSDVTNNGFKGKFTPFDSFIPYANNSYDLGSSGKQWNNLYAKRVNTQSVNGVNPGALSLPGGVASNSIAVDITDWYIQDPDYPDDPTKKILDATNHKVDTAVPGWLHIIFPNVAGNWAYARQYAAGVNMDLQRIADGVASSDFANVELIFPIYSSCYVRIKAKTATVRIFPCLGNV